MRIKSEWGVRLLLLGTGLFPVLAMAWSGGDSLPASAWAVGLGAAVVLPLLATGLVCDWLFRNRLARLKQWCAAVRQGDAVFWEDFPNEAQDEDCWPQLYRDLNWLIHQLRRQIGETETQRQQAQTAYCRMRQLALVDPLTQLANRRHFQEHLCLEWQRDERAAKGLALVMIDLDHFKAINDHHGHDVGDLVLQRVGRKLAAAARPPHLAARIGGEEFIVILTGVDDLGAKQFALRLHRLLQEEWEAAGGAVSVTCSIGGCAISGEALPDVDSVLKKVDLALYQGKNSGRNCVWWWDWQKKAPRKVS